MNEFEQLNATVDKVLSGIESLNRKLDEFANCLDIKFSYKKSKGEGLLGPATCSAASCQWKRRMRQGPCGKTAICDVVAPGLESIATCEKHMLIAKKQSWLIQMRQNADLTRGGANPKM
jgi:hypothetical protein